jgi:glycosyltransferase involved in cell wall biosynthesis
MALSFFPCFFPPKSGGESRLYNLYYHLSSRADIRILSSTHSNQPRSTIIHAPFLTEYRSGKQPSFGDCYAKLTAIGSTGDLSGLAVGLDAFEPNDLHLTYLEHYHWADIIIHASPFTLPIDLMLGLDSKPRVYDAYNAEHVLMRSMHPGARARPLHEFADAAERVLVNSADLVAHCTEEDKIELERLVGRPLRRSLLVPNGCSLSVAAAGPGASPHRLVFVGSHHAPNVEAVRFLIEHVAPRLPDFELHIMGACAEPGRPRDNVICHGRVTDQHKAQIFRESGIALNPVFSGSGSNLKALDYLAAGLPVVATAFGMRGTAAEPGLHYMQAELSGFAEAVAELASADGQRAAIAAAGQRLVEGHMLWPAIARDFGDELDAVLAAAAEQPTFVLCLNDYDPAGGFGGGATRMRGLHQALAEQEPVVVLCLYDGETLQRVWLAYRLLVIKVPKTAAHRKEGQRIDALLHVSSADIVSCRLALDNPILVGLYGVLRRNARIVVLEHPYMAPLPASFGDQFVYSSQNEEYALKDRSLAGHPEHAALAATVREVEDFCLRTARLTVAVSTHDAEMFSRRQRDIGAPIIVVPNGADAPTEPEPEDLAHAASVGTRSAVFLGSAHIPNVEALWLLCDVIAPALPEVEFHILGSVGQAAGTTPSNVRVWGEVSPSLKTAILRRAAIALNPVYSGGGSNVKMSDYFAHGLPTVTSEFGLRGYPPSVKPFVETADAVGCAAAITRLLARFSPAGKHRSELHSSFAQQLSMASHGAHYAERVRALDAPRRRLLAVTYRYTDPMLGGAEVMLHELLRHLDQTGRWAIDVVCPDVGHITDFARFTCAYGSADGFGAPSGLTATRWRRFATKYEPLVGEAMLEVWRVQVALEEALAVDTALAAAAAAGPRLLTGWYNKEADGEDLLRWTTQRATFHSGAGGQLRLRGWAPCPKEFVITCADATLSGQVDGHFEFDAEIPAGVAALHVEAQQLGASDMRPLGVRLTHLAVGDRSLLADPTLIEDLPTLPYAQRIAALDRAARATRWRAGVELTKLRGPRSPALNAWLQENIGKYEVLVTHNCVFLPCLEVLQMAAEQGVPSVFLPHMHPEDDFYHFPDVMRTVELAGVSLVSPSAAVDFLRREVSPRVRYFGAGADPAEFDVANAERDMVAFRDLLPDDGRPILVVLGRKAGAKNYAMTLEARRRLAARGIAARVVMIGPDDDRVPIDEEGVVYLGLQPREVVRGALRSARVLVNMSMSESFGIVLLEGWLGGAPVVAYRGCNAFADLVEEGVNGFLVDDVVELTERLADLLTDPELGPALAARGRDVAMTHTWARLGDQFELVCTQMARDGEIDEVWGGATAGEPARW